MMHHRKGKEKKRKNVKRDMNFSFFGAPFLILLLIFNIVLLPSNTEAWV